MECHDGGSDHEPHREAARDTVVPHQARKPGGAEGEKPDDDRHGQAKRVPRQGAQSSEPEGDVGEALLEDQARDDRGNRGAPHERDEHEVHLGVQDPDRLEGAREHHDEGEEHGQPAVRVRSDVGGRRC